MYMSFSQGHQRNADPRVLHKNEAVGFLASAIALPRGQRPINRCDVLNEYLFFRAWTCHHHFALYAKDLQWSVLADDEFHSNGITTPPSRAKFEAISRAYDGNKQQKHKGEALTSGQSGKKKSSTSSTNFVPKKSMTGSKTERT